MKSPGKISGLFKIHSMNATQFKKWVTGLTMLLLFSCVSTKKVIQDAQAFVITPQQGTVQVDEKGNEVSPLPSPVIIVFVHSKSNELNWDSAWFNNRSYAIKQQLITQPFEMGVDGKTGEKITLTPKEGTFLFQLQIVPKLSKGEEWANSIRLRGSIRNKTVYKEISPIRSIQTPDAQ